MIAVRTGVTGRRGRLVAGIGGRRKAWLTIGTQSGSRVFGGSGAWRIILTKT
jgi:hypothetical protein